MIKTERRETFTPWLGSYQTCRA